MGYRICYLAARMEPAAMARAFGLTVSGTAGEIPDYGAWWAARAGDTGWSILWAHDETFGEKSLDRIAALSHETDVQHCVVNETVMCSSAELWSGGRRSWRVTHDGSGENAFDLTVEGTPPAMLVALRERHFAAQREAEDVDHVFEVPLDLAAEQTGFRYGDGLALNGPDGVLLLEPPRRASLLARLFGRR